MPPPTETTSGKHNHLAHSFRLCLLSSVSAAAPALLASVCKSLFDWKVKKINVFSVFLQSSTIHRTHRKATAHQAFWRASCIQRSLWYEHNTKRGFYWEKKDRARQSYSTCWWVDTVERPFRKSNCSRRQLHNQRASTAYEPQWASSAFWSKNYTCHLTGNPLGHNCFVYNRWLICDKAKYLTSMAGQMQLFLYI